ANGDLELAQFRVAVILGLASHRVGPVVRVFQDVVRLGSSTARDLFLERHPALVLVRLLDDPLALGPSLAQQILAILHDPPSLFDLLRDALLHLRDHLQELLPAHEDRGGQWHRFRLEHQLLELLEARREIHQASTSRSISSFRTWSGTSPSTSPP